MTDVIRAAAAALGVFTIVTTALPVVFPRAKAWWIRIFDFPRLQLAVIGAVALGLEIPLARSFDWPWVILPVFTATAVLYQIARIWRYTPLAPREVQRSNGSEPGRRISLVLTNVLQDNRNAARLVQAVREAEPTLILCVETDDWWRQQLDVLTETHPYSIQCPLPNTYGMVVYSRLPLEDGSVDFLIEDDVPSIQAVVRLESGVRIWINCLHPRPPAPGESDSSAQRDAELVVVAKRVRRAATPVLVCGDLNDVAWSRTTRLFQKISRLVDPRKGRGFFGTFHASYPFLRYPLDHVFHSDDFRLVQMRLLPHVGSDHFPVFVELSYEPDAAAAQEAPTNDHESEAEGNETVARARSGEDGGAKG
jgi:endonuclease/exonuclease/phosphatase (EEP) superfamily protein YafD